MPNGLSLDIEDYWSVLDRDWLLLPTSIPSESVVRNTNWFLKVLSDRNVKATFFILGEIAEHYPSLVKTIFADGHEIGVHGFYHRQVFKLNRRTFEIEIGDAKKLLEDITSSPVIGHRAPAFSINQETTWALDVLAELGFKYDSSIFPVSCARYGWKGFSQDICKVRLASGNSIIEIPMSVLKIFNIVLPVAGGGYIRHFPYSFTKWGMNRIQRQRPVIVYLHPYEIDIEGCKLPQVSLEKEVSKRLIKHHKMQLRNRATMPYKISKLLEDFSFVPLNQIMIKFSEINNIFDVG